MPVLSAPAKLSVSDFLALPESNEVMELVDGEIIVTPRPRTDHQILVAWLGHLLLARVGKNGKVIFEKEMQVATPDGRVRIRCPDLLYVSADRSAVVTAELLTDGADLVIEILSESTQEVDRIAKRDEYRVSGVDEYWIVDIVERAVLIHSFAEDRQQLFQGTQTFDSALLRTLGLPSAFTVEEVFDVLD